MTDEEIFALLQSFVKEATIDFDKENKVAELLNEMTKKKVIENHPYEIYTINKKGVLYFVTYVHDETKLDHRRQITAKTKENLENKIYKHYKQKNLLTFEKVSIEYLKYYKATVKDTTFARTMSDYKRFIPQCSFSQKSITAIKPIDIKEYLQNTILKEKLKKRAYSNLRALLNGIFRYALDKEYIFKNPMADIMISTANIQHPTRKTKEEEVFTNKEKDLIRDYIKADHNNYKNTVPFAILLSFQLGLRVSELVALKWSDIDSNMRYIHIQRQETICNKYNDDLVQIKASVHEIREYTKTQAGNRLLPLTQEALRILKDIETWNISNGIKSEYIFSDADGRTFNRQRINTCLYSYCNKVNIIKKSSHKIRRSVISSLLDNIANKKAVQSFAGHEELETTLNSYYKDITDDDDLYNGMCACL